MRMQDEGFTLIELLLSMAILVIVISSVSLALIVFLQNGNEALARDDHSGGVQLIDSYLDRDVASATTVATGTTGGAGCGAGAIINLVELTWSEYTATMASPSPAPSGPAYRAVYRLMTDPDGGFQLQRNYCSGTTLIDSSILLRRLTAATNATANVGAAGSCTSGSALTFKVASYGSDTTTPYAFTTCVKTRVS